MSKKGSESLSIRVAEIVSQGLVAGVGEPVAGQLCVEAAICMALGEQHGDRPSCVHEVDRRYSMSINDAAWSSEKARAKALLPLAIAQLGTVDCDRDDWIKYVVIQTVRRVLPVALRFYDLEVNALECENAFDLESARVAARAARVSARSAADAARSAVARSVAAAAAYAADAADAVADAARVADAVAYAARVAAHSARSDDKMLQLSIDIAIEAYQKYPHYSQQYNHELVSV